MLHRLLLSVFIAWTALGSAHAGDVRIASWNIQHLGWGENKSYQAVSKIGGMFDFIAVQEAMSEEGLEKLQAALEEATRAPWELMQSHRIGRGSYQEKYAFFWRPDRIEYIDGAVVYLDTTDQFARDPYSARFRIRDSNVTFVAATVHILYGDTVGDRTPEIQALLDYWKWLAEVYPDDVSRRMLLGDFNLPPDHAAWGAMREVARPLITSGATTLSSVDGRYANLYDNIWVPLEHALPIRDAGILRFPELLNASDASTWTHAKARRHVSDHAPVYALMADAELLTLEGKVTDLGEPTCVDLNRASLGELQELMHIGPERAKKIEAGRPWVSVDALKQISGISQARLRSIQKQEIVCGEVP